MIRVQELRDAVDRARDEISDPRVFDDVIKRSMFDFELACADASHPEIVNDPEVAAACSVLGGAVAGLLFARGAAYGAGFFKRAAANRDVDRAGLVAHTALDEVNEAVKRAWVIRYGFDIRTDQGFEQALISAVAKSD